jgi:hypothetical protein
LNSGFLRAAAILLALVCSSCLECREEFWLEADGSGRAEIRASVPASVLAMQGGEAKVGKLLAEFLRDTPEIRGSTYQIRREGDRAAIDLDLTFTSALDLAEVTKGPSAKALPEAATHLAGEIETRFRGRTLELERSVAPGKALPGSAFLPASTFEGRRLVSIVHLPEPAFDHNATRVGNGGRTLIWDVPVAEAMRKPMVSRFKMKVPVPWGLVAGIGIPVCLLAAWGFARWRNARQRRAAGV